MRLRQSHVLRKSEVTIWTEVEIVDDHRELI